MNILVKRSKGLGDAVFAMQACVAYKEEHPGAKVWFDGAEDLSKYCSDLEQDTPPDDVEVFDLNHVNTLEEEDRTVLMGKSLGISVKGWKAMFKIPLKGEYSNYTGIHPGTPSATRRLSTIVMRTLLKKLPGKKLVFDGLDLVQHDEAGDVIKRTMNVSREEALIAAASCKEFIGMDSGPTHVAIACEVPTVAVFSHMNPLHILAEAAKTKKIAIVQPTGLSCGPCGDFTWPPKCENTARFASCCTSLTPNDVMQGYNRLISGSRKEDMPMEGCDVLFITPWLLHGGGGTWLNIVTQGLIDRDIRVKVISTSSQDDGSSDCIKDHIIAIGLSDPYRLAEIIDELKPTAILYQHDPLVLYALEHSKWKPTKVVCTRHVVWPSGTPNLYKGPLVDKYVTDFVCVSNCTTKCLDQERGSNIPPIQTIYNAVVPRVAAPVAYPVGESKGDYFTIGAVSRLDMAKHLDLLIDAVAYFRQTQNAKVKGFIVGGGDYGMYLQERIEAHGIEKFFTMVGPKENPWPYYKHMDLHVLPTEAEGGLPLSMMEAMECGVACAITKVADVQDIWKDKDSVFMMDKVTTFEVVKCIAMAQSKNTDLPKIAARGKEDMDAVTSLQSMIDGYVNVLGFGYEVEVEERLRALGYIE